MLQRAWAARSPASAPGSEAQSDELLDEGVEDEELSLLVSDLVSVFAGSDFVDSEGLLALLDLLLP